jgi:hypothetical protein
MLTKQPNTKLEESVIMATKKPYMGMRNCMPGAVWGHHLGMAVASDHVDI